MSKDGTFFGWLLICLDRRRLVWRGTTPLLFDCCYRNPHLVNHLMPLLEHLPPTPEVTIVSSLETWGTRIVIGGHPLTVEEGNRECTTRTSPACSYMTAIPNPIILWAGDQWEPYRVCKRRQKIVPRVGP